MKKYICYGGWIKSIYDGDFHFITSRRVAELYKVNYKECIFVDNEDQGRGLSLKDKIELYPSTDGNYSLREVKE